MSIKSRKEPGFYSSPSPDNPHEFQQGTLPEQQGTELHWSRQFILHHAACRRFPGANRQVLRKANGHVLPLPESPEMPGKQGHQNRLSWNTGSWLQEGGSAGNPKTNTKRQRDRRTKIKSPFPNRTSYSKKSRRRFLKNREREAVGNVVRKGRGGQFSEDWVFLSSSLQWGRALCLHAVAARKGAGICT